MTSISLLLLLLGAVLVTSQSSSIIPSQTVPEVDQRCLDCICQASSNCDEDKKCHKGPSTGSLAGGGYFCGPYVMSWAYWHDGGRPGGNGIADDYYIFTDNILREFETCLNNRTCAEEAIRGYMRKYGRDCDASATIDCYDYARIHKLGYNQCSTAEIYNSDYWQKFEVCYNSLPINLVLQPQVFDYNGALQQGQNAFYAY